MDIFHEAFDEVGFTNDGLEKVVKNRRKSISE